MKYFLFPNQAIVSVGGKTYTIGKHDYRFGLLKENLGDAFYIERLVSHAMFGEMYAGCTYRDGVMYAGTVPLPESVAECALTAKYNSTSVMAIVNLWLSAVRRLDPSDLDSFKRDIARIRPFNDEASMLIISGESLNYLTGFDVCRVGRDENLPTHSFEQLMQACFADKDTKAVRKIVLNKLKEHGELDLSIFLYGAIGEMMDVNNLLSVMELGCSYQISSDEVLLKEIKEGKPRVKAMFGDLTLKKFKHLFTSSASIHDLLNVTDNLREVLQIKPDYVVPAFEDLGGISAALSNIKRRYTSIKVPYKQFLDKWGAIDGLMVDEDEIILPKDSYELGDWGVEMAHCIGGDSYSDGLQSGERFLWGVRRKGRLWATGYIELANNNVRKRQQFYGKKNKEIPEKDKYFDMMEFLLENINIIASFRQAGFNRISMADIEKIVENLKKQAAVEPTQVPLPVEEVEPVV